MPSTFHYTIDELIPYIDWVYFFHAWQTKAESVEGMRLKADALQLLHSLAATTGASARYSELKAIGCGDDIIVQTEVGTYNDKDCHHTLHIPFLRQQKASADGYTLCLSDFVNPYDDTIGFFATTSTFHASKEANPYLQLLSDTLASRLSEAAAEKLDHDIHGIPQATPLTGIRPAVGYPSIPDLSIIFLIDQLIDMQSIGITLTDHGAMHPQSSVAGLMIPHLQAHYFTVSTIDEEQFLDYAHRRGYTPDQLRPFLRTNFL